MFLEAALFGSMLPAIPPEPDAWPFRHAPADRWTLVVAGLQAEPNFGSDQGVSIVTTGGVSID